ncbi:unnamed protein product [Parnassius mnemosyne]
MGIPFAAPPLNEFRFLPPQTINPWANVLSAVKEKPPCIQFNNNVKKNQIGQYGVEDCLYLDIFTPAVDDNKRAVVVFLYNENFRYSYNKTKDYSPDFFIEEDVVLATISHRLSTFGFLSFEDDILPGNAGLKDIVAGLHWIKNNIERFGGDPNRITLMGSQGGAAAIDLLIHTKAKKLFNAAILQSGTSLSPQYLQNNIRERAFKLSELLERSTSNSNQLLKYLNEIPAEKIFEKELNALPDDYYKENQKPLLTFGPIVEGNQNGLVTGYPEKIFNTVTIPLMIGSNSREGLEPSLQYLFDPRYLVYLEKDFHFLIPIRSNLKFDPLKETFYNAIEDIKKFYFRRGKIRTSSISDYITYIGDILTSYPVDAMVRMYSNKSSSSVFYYHFDYYSELNANKENILKFSTVGDGTWGAASGDELCYLFKCPRLINNYKKLNTSMSEEITLQRKLVKLWTNFAKYGNPTPEINNPLDIKWPSYNLVTKQYLHISKNVEIKCNLFEERFQFWEEFLNKWQKLLNEVSTYDTYYKDDL